MNRRDIATWECASQARAHHHDHSHTDHAPFWQHTIRGVAVIAIQGHRISRDADFWDLATVPKQPGLL